MKFRFFAALLIVPAFFCLPLFATTCESLASLALPQVKITAAESVAPGTFVAEGKTPMPNLPAFCRVAATLTPTPDSDIRIEVWMPTVGWNGKYEGTGNGGFAGGIAYGGLADGLQRGFAVANTDMGTSHPGAASADALIGHPERWADWGWRSTHDMTVTAKEIVQAYYGRKPELSYFSGCSTGGEQALMEAQRFPDDYDGILAGAAANNRTRLHIAIFWSFAAFNRTPADNLPPAKLPMITNALLNACAGAKAVPSDAFLTRPQDCHWDPGALLCKAGDAPDCLTATQVTAVRKLYSGPIDPVTHALIYPGVPRGSEFGWTGFMSKDDVPPFDSLFKWVFGPDWKWRSFDFDRDVAAVDARLGPMLNADNPDLDTFKAHGHKLLVFHGWADWLVPSQEEINYYRRVESAQSAAAASHDRSEDEETQTFMRLFMVPGMSHCGSGPGLTAVDPLPSLELWVEKGIAPKEIMAWRSDDGKTVMTRPACPYPLTARYDGSGNPKDAASFSCASPEEGGSK